MILGHLNTCERYEKLHALFPKAFAFLKGTDLAKLPDGKSDIDGDELFAIVSRNSDSENDNKLEAHRKYIDIHYAAQGSDTIGWKPLHACTTAVSEFDVEKDVILFNDGDHTTVSLKEGQFVIVYPEDAHAPLLKTKGLLKIVLKIKL